MQLFLHILKMTWLTVASGLDIIHHQDRTGEASAGKLKIGKGRSWKICSWTWWFHWEIKAFAGQSGGAHDWDAKNTVLGSLWPSPNQKWKLIWRKTWGETFQKKINKVKKRVLMLFFHVGQLWVIFSKRRNALRLDFWVAWHVFLHRSMYLIMIFLLPMTPFFQSLFSMCQGSTLIPSWGVSSYTNVPTMIYELLCTRYQSVPCGTRTVSTKKTCEIYYTYFESGFFFGEKDALAFQLFPGIYCKFVLRQGLPLPSTLPKHQGVPLRLKWQKLGLGSSAMFQWNDCPPHHDGKPLGIRDPSPRPTISERVLW